MSWPSLSGNFFGGSIDFREVFTGVPLFFSRRGGEEGRRGDLGNLSHTLGGGEAGRFVVRLVGGEESLGSRTTTGL